MTKRNQALTFKFAAASLALLLAACAPLRTNSFVERGVDLRVYKTYAWGTTDAFSTGDPRLDNNRFFDEAVRAAVDKELALQSFEKTAESADLLIHYHASVTQEIDVSRLEMFANDCREDDCRPRVYDKGTLFVDFVDASTGQLLWRGWADTDLDHAIDSQELMVGKITAAAARIFQTLPGRG